MTTDNMVAYAMQQEQIDLFTSAADTIARDGHIANKIPVPLFLCGSEIRADF